jgi:hypothetical protein
MFSHARIPGRDVVISIWNRSGWRTGQKCMDDHLKDLGRDIVDQDAFSPDRSGKKYWSSVQAFRDLRHLGRNIGGQ